MNTKFIPAQESFERWLLIPEQVAHRFRNDVARRFRDDRVRCSDLMSPIIPG